MSKGDLKYKKLSTNIGYVNGILDGDRLIIENENPRLGQFLPPIGNHLQVIDTKNILNDLFVYQEPGYEGSWVYRGRDYALQDAFTPPPFIFERKVS